MAIQKIAVSISGSNASLITAKYAIYLAKQFQATLYSIYVVDEKSLHELLKSRIFVEIEAVEYEHDLKNQGKMSLERIVKMAESKGVSCEPLLLEGVIHEAVVNKVRELAADLLVIGDLKEVLSAREVFYDEGERIFRESPCPVVVVKNPLEVERWYKAL